MGLTPVSGQRGGLGSGAIRERRHDVWIRINGIAGRHIYGLRAACEDFADPSCGRRNRGMVAHETLSSRVAVLFRPRGGPFTGQTASNARALATFPVRPPLASKP